MDRTVIINELIEFLRADKAVGTHFRMGAFVEPVDLNARRDKNGLRPGYHYYKECGTACCLAGWINILQAKRTRPEILQYPSKDERYISPFTSYMEDSVSPGDLLNLSEGQRQELFFMHGCTVELEHFDETCYVPLNIRYDAGIRVLEILRDENVVDWDRALTESGFDFSAYNETIEEEKNL